MSVAIEDISKNFQALETYWKRHDLDSLNILQWSNEWNVFSIMLSDLTNLFYESPETCVLKSLSISITQKNQIIMRPVLYFCFFYWAELFNNNCANSLTTNVFIAQIVLQDKLLWISKLRCNFLVRQILFLL